jgi:hypothetical protein
MIVSGRTIAAALPISGKRRYNQTTLGDASFHTDIGDARRKLCPKGIPTARLLERELRENQGN